MFIFVFIASGAPWVRLSDGRSEINVYLKNLHPKYSTSWAFFTASKGDPQEGRKVYSIIFYFPDPNNSSFEDQMKNLITL